MAVIEDTIQQMVLPNSPENLEEKAKQNLAEQLKKQIKAHFKKYYEEVKHREDELLAQCDNIALGGTAEENIDHIL